MPKSLDEGICIQLSSSPFKQAMIVCLSERSKSKSLGEMSLPSGEQDVNVIKTAAKEANESMCANFMGQCVRECLGKFRSHLRGSTDDCAALPVMFVKRGSRPGEVFTPCLKPQTSVPSSQSIGLSKARSERVRPSFDLREGNPLAYFLGIERLHFRKALHSHEHHPQFVSLGKGQQCLLAC